MRKAIYILKLLTHKAAKGVGVAQWAESKVIVERSIMSLAGDGTARRDDVSPEVIDSSPAVVNTRMRTRLMSRLVATGGSIIIIQMSTEIH